MGTHSTRGTRGRTMSVAGAVAATLALAACGSELAGAPAGDLPLLRIGTGSYAGEAVGAPAAGSGRDPYPLEGTLPGGPSSATVLRYGDRPVPAAEVSALAAALGVTGTPVRHEHGWEVASRAGTVRVRDGGTAWSFARGTSQCPSYAVDVDNADDATAAVGCAVAEPPASSGSGGATTPPTPTDAAARAAAAPVLAAVGLPGAAARVLPGTGPRTVVVDPVVDGSPTSGARTVVQVGPAGVLGALGVLAAPTPGRAYPIVTAAAALDLLRAMPQPEIAIACVVGAECPGVGPRVVTGAVLGRTLAHDGGSVVLVPAWLFTIRGSDDPVAVVAVERRYLAEPAPATDGGAGASAVPGATGSPIPPSPAEPATAASASDLPAQAPAYDPSATAVSATTRSGSGTTG